MAPDDIQQIAVAVGTAVGQAVAQALVPVLTETRNAVDALRSDVFSAMESKVSNDACTRTHASLPPILILTAIGGSSVLSSIITAIAVSAMK